MFRMVIAPICPTDAVFNYKVPLFLPLLLSILCTGMSADCSTNWKPSTSVIFVAYIKSMPVSDYTASFTAWLQKMNLKKMCKEVVVAQLKVIYLERLFENDEEPQQEYSVCLPGFEPASSQI